MKRPRREPGPGGFQRLVAIRSRLSRCSSQRELHLTVTQNTWRGSLLKHSRSLHLETLYRLYFFFVIYTINVERETAKGERKGSVFTEEKMEGKKTVQVPRVYVIRESSLSLSLAHDKSMYILIALETDLLFQAFQNYFRQIRKLKLSAASVPNCQ
jgi:hypothetical protein